jgi:hypothetical protein
MNLYKHEKNCDRRIKRSINSTDLSVDSSGQDGFDEFLKIEAFHWFHFQFLEKFVQFVFWHFFAWVQHDILELFFGENRCKVAFFLLIFQVEYGPHCFNELLFGFGFFVFAGLRERYLARSARKSAN